MRLAPTPQGAGGFLLEGTPMRLNTVPRQFGPSSTLLVSLEEPGVAARRGTILLYHGLHGRKEVNLREMEMIAERGFLVVGVDQWGHGERETPETRTFLDGEHPEFPSRFITAVRHTAGEVPGLVDSLVASSLAFEDRLGITGVSMGGYVSYAAAVLDRRLRTVVSIVGCPWWRELPAECPASRPEAFEHVALLSINACLDRSVPCAPAREFHSGLAAMFPAAQERHVYHEYPESEHILLPADWADCMERMIGWFERWVGRKWEL